MKRLLLLLLCISLLTACQDKKTFILNEDVYFDNDTKEFLDIYNGKPVSGRVIDQHDEFWTECDIKKGKAHGLYTLYVDGNKLQEMSYKNGKIHGMLRAWEDGLIVGEIQYKDGEALRMRCFDKNGAVTKTIDSPIVDEYLSCDE